VGEIEACRPWLEAEAEAVSPRAIVALGATAARAVFGPGVKVMRDRGRPLETPLAPMGTVTIHPSAVLRVRQKDEREDALAAMVADLAAIDRDLGG
jgi:DNA polymerase